MSARLARASCAALKTFLPIALASLVCLAGCAQPAPKMMGGVSANAPTAGTVDLGALCASAALTLWPGSPDCTQDSTDGQLALSVPVTSSFHGVSAEGYQLVDASSLVDMQPDGMTGQQGVLILDATQSH